MASGERRPRRGPAPIASFDHDVSDESPETKQTFQLPEIREDAGCSAGPARLAPAPEGRARSASTPGLGAPAAPRIDISRASSSSHHDSRDSSPELALFAGAPGEAPDHLGFREDGALDLRSSTEELAFLEPEPAPAPPAPPPPAVPAPRRHSRKDSQGSEAALLAISGRTSRLSSIGSQCSAHSAISAVSHTSRVSRLSVVSGVSRSPSPHKMLLETSFCGPKPIETDPEICAAVVEERLLEIAKMQVPMAAVAPAAPPPGDARDRREVRTEVTVEPARPTRAAPTPATDPPAVAVTPATDDKTQKESRNRARVEERRARSRERRDLSEPEVYKNRNRSKDVIRIKLKPDDAYEDDNDDDEEECEPTLTSGAAARKPESLALSGPAPVDRGARSPSPAPPLPSRKSSFCSLFKSRETIASPDSPSDALRRKKSLNEGRSRSKSRDRSAPPSSAGKIRGSVLSLFKTPRRSGASPSPSSRATSPSPAVAPASVPPPTQMRGLKYYEDSRDGIIHIPLRTPPNEEPGTQPETEPRETIRPASAPCARPPPAKPTQRTVLPDGSIIIPLHSPTEREPPPTGPHRTAAVVEPVAVEPTHRARPPPEPALASEPPAKTEPPPSDAGRPAPTTTTTPSKMSTTPSEPAPPGWNYAETTTNPTPVKPPSPGWIWSGTSASSAAVTPADPLDATTPATPAVDAPHSRRKERLVFTTHVGSTEQVFCTQFSITKTPSVTSEISESFPSLCDEPRAAPVLRDTHIASSPRAASPRTESPGAAAASSESEGSGTEVGAAGGAVRGSDAEQRGLVVQESFEDELPYVPTTLPLERSLALPMLPVRDRGPQLQATASVERPRGARSFATPLPPPSVGAVAPPVIHGGPTPSGERLRIQLPRRASTTQPATTQAAPPLTHSRKGSEGGSNETRKAEWIDFSEVPERRKAARRIQTLPPRAEPPPEPTLSYVEPDQCRCECHRTSEPEPDTSPLLHQIGSPEDVSGRPFTADLDVRDEARS